MMTNRNGIARAPLLALVATMGLFALWLAPSRRPAPPSTRLLTHQPTNSPSAPAFTVTDLGTLGGSGSIAYDVSERGHVVGISETSDGRVHGFLYEGGRLRDIGPPSGYDHSVAEGVNAAGQVVGAVVKEGRDGRIDPFLYRDGRMNVGRPPLGGPAALASAINARGAIAGTSLTRGGEVHAFLHADGKTHDLGTLGGPESYAFDLNDAGEVAGASLNRAGEYHALTWREGRKRDLGTLGGPYSAAYGISKGGLVAGDSLLAGGHERFHAFLAAGGRMRDIGSLHGLPHSCATGVNHSGEAVGYAYNPDRDPPEVRAFVFWREHLLDLNTLIPPDSGWQLLLATAISDRGQIAGAGIHQGQLRAFLLTPTGKGAAAPPALPGGVTALVFSPDPRLIAPGELDGKIRLWPRPAITTAWLSAWYDELGEGIARRLPCRIHTIRLRKLLPGAASSTSR